MAERKTYRTRQRALIEECLATNGDRYLTVREVCDLLETKHGHVGHTTVYRNLEAMTSRGAALKFLGVGGETRYRIALDRSCGQLVCLDCGRVQLLDCGMLGSFADHVRADHDFDVEVGKTVLFGHCTACQTENANAD